MTTLAARLDRLEGTAKPGEVTHIFIRYVHDWRSLGDIGAESDEPNGSPSPMEMDAVEQVILREGLLPVAVWYEGDPPAAVLARARRGSGMPMWRAGR